MTLHGNGTDSTQCQEHDYAWLQQQFAAAGLDAAALQAATGAQAEGDAAEEWKDPSEGLLSAVFRICEEGCGDPPESLTSLLQQLPSAPTNPTDIQRANRSSAVPSSFSIDTPGPDGDSALHLAALFGHLPCVQALLKAGAHPGIVNPLDGSTVLHDAVAGGYTEIAELILLGAPETVQAADEDGDTPLHHAARGGHLSLVQRLLAAGADPTVRNNSQQTPAGEADGEREVISLLVAAAAKWPAATPVTAAEAAEQ